MLFFTRELYEGYQPNSGWERRALNEWDRRVNRYEQYSAAIAPMLPSPVLKLCKHTLHDGIVHEVKRTGDEISLTADATNALGGFRRRIVTLIFRGVANRPRMTGLIGQWWLYEEAHLTSRSRFSLHVLFDRSEMEIEADELQIVQSKVRRHR
jgi:hypothetical protein